MSTRQRLVVALFVVFAVGLSAQSLNTGDLTGTVVDASGALVAKATVTLQNNSTGAKQTTVSNTQGTYRFPFLPPGSYTISVEAPGFQAAMRTMQVTTGEAAVVEVQMALAATKESLDVTDAALAVQSDNADLTTNITNQQVANLPNPGNDLTFYALLAPGVTMSTNGGYGNFTSYGISATSNMFTLNGAESNDVFLNTPTSGASNLVLGSNDVAEVTVVNNGYSGQYGGLAGTQMNVVSKSGGNQFHGNAIYYWNGSALNANNFFNNASGTEKPFSNSNMWAASIGGPIKKDKTHFFFDYEGLRLVFPTNNLVKIPSADFAAATLANLAATGQTTAVPFYQKMFDLYAAAPGASAATPVAGGGCGAFKGLAAGVPCAVQFRSDVGNFTKEYVWTARVDHTFSERDRAFVQLQRDNGTQPTYTDPINAAFNAFSPQPQMNGQISENHVFGSTAVNQFMVTGQYSSVRFGPANMSQTLATFPTMIAFTGTLFNNIGGGGDGRSYPLGRNTTQYQFIDDFSKTWNRQTLKVGVNFHRVDLTNLDLLQFINGRITESNLTDFFNGGGTGNRLTQRFPSSPEAPFAYYNLGFYVQDDIRVTRNFKVNLTLRADHNSNPICNTACLANLSTPFAALNHDPSIPYNQAISSGLSQSFPSTNGLVWQPRIGFAWTPTKSGKTVIRGGIGIFGDTFPGLVTEGLAKNTPQLNNFSISNGKITPGVAGGLFATAAAANQSLLSAFANGGTLASIRATNPFFAVPNYTATQGQYQQAQYQEWSLELQQALPGNMTLSASYVGNHGIHEVIQNAGVNMWAAGFPGLPSAAPDPRFNIVTEYQTGGVSNYNGMVLSLRRRFSAGLSFQLNYTWSHALDDVSNGGFAQYDLMSDISLLNPTNPYDIRRSMYGNSDYDIRHYFSGNYVWDNSLRHLFKGGPNFLFSGWTVAGTVYARSGAPFSVIDSAAAAGLASHGFTGSVFGTVTGSGPSSCGSSAVDTSCFLATQFAPSTSLPTSFSPQTRNQFRGPQYFDTDLSVMKNFQVGKWETAKLAVGVQFFNLLNHPNFDKPINDVAQGSSFGMIQSTISAPTSILGTFVGADASGRIIQVKGTFTF